MPFRAMSMLLLLVASTFAAPSFAAEQYVQITGNNVNVRFAPATSSIIVVQAKQGDAFELYEVSGDWYGIFMFSGEARYVHRSLARVTQYVPQLPDTVVRRKLFRALWDIEGRTQNEADMKYPLADRYNRPIQGNLYKNIDYERMLHDRYGLQAFHRFRVQPALRKTIAVEGLKKEWWK